MVASVDGKATVGGKAGSIGSPTDRILMRTLRVHADAVMTGAGTLRAERLTLAVPESFASLRESLGFPPQPLAVVATVSGDIPLEANLIGFSSDNLLVLASSETPEERLATLALQASIEVVAPREARTTGPNLDLTVALEILKSRYAVDVLLVEGGPALNHALVSAGLADELFLTLAPKLLGSTRSNASTILEGPILQSQESPKLELISIHLSESELFLRYALLR